MRRSRAGAVYQCNRCKHQVGLTAGTVFHWTKLPLTTWFLAIYHLTQSKGGMSSVELARRLGTRQPTAWLMKHKLMAAMETARRRQTPARWPGRDRRRLSGRAALGAASAGGVPPARRRSWPPWRRPPSASRRRLRLTVVKGFRKKEIAALAKRDFAAGSNVVSDGLSCWAAVEAAGCTHFPMTTGSGPQAARWVPFTWVNTALGNIKTALAGTYHHVSAEARAALSFQLRLALQPPLPARQPDRASGLCLRPDRTTSLPGHHRRMSERDGSACCRARALLLDLPDGAARLHPRLALGLSAIAELDPVRLGVSGVRQPQPEVAPE